MSKYKIQRYKSTLTIADGQTSASESSVALNGILKGLLVNAPNLDGSVTLTVTITDADSFTVYSKSSISENTKTAIYLDASNNPLEIPLSGNHTITITASGSQSGGNDTVEVILLIER